MKKQEKLITQMMKYPYESAKPMYLVDDIDNKELLREIVIETCKRLAIKKVKK